METVVLLNIHERRVSLHLSHVIDDALDLADECGWRYALTYLISENVPSPVIQRLLFGGGRTRPSESHREGSLAWKSAHDDEMKSLFDWLRQRRSVDACERDKTTPCASRSSAPVEIE
jgi:hypothetical protein